MAKHIEHRLHRPAPRIGLDDDLWAQPRLGGQQQPWLAQPPGGIFKLDLHGAYHPSLQKPCLGLNAAITHSPQIAARLLGVLSHWRRYDAHRQELMKFQLERILRAPKLSPDVYEIVTKSLEDNRAIASKI